jgi:ubiquinone/menaquinone biosynthesis C-methylase UbiE
MTFQIKGRALTWTAAVLLAAVAAVLSAAGQVQDRTPKRLTNPKYTAAQFDRISREVFGPIYPYLAQQVKREFAISSGTAVDLGSGSGLWAIELARITDLRITALDIDPEAVKIARRNVAAAGLTGRITTIEADVQKMPFPDGSVDLVISRGSYPFWKDREAAFREVLRILKPGGGALIGGGLGSLLPGEERTRIRALMDEQKIGPPQELEMTFPQMSAVLRRAGIFEFTISPDAGCLCGLWVQFRKPSAASR